MNQKNDNFIDKTFTVLADILLKVLPVNKDEKQAFSYYRYGMSAQSNGDYAEALENYYEALKLEEDPYDRSYILYNIGLIYGEKENFYVVSFTQIDNYLYGYYNDKLSDFMSIKRLKYYFLTFKLLFQH